MKTMTRPAAETDRPAPGKNLRPSAERPLGTDRSGRSSQVVRSKWVLVAVASAIVTILAAPDLTPWLLLPIGPAALLRAADRDGSAPCAIRVLRVFSVATLGAVLAQLAASDPAVALAIAAFIGTALFLVATERLAVA